MFRFHKTLDIITLFHRPQLQSSIRALALLKQASAEASSTATEDQASDHGHHNKAQQERRSQFELNVSEDPPTVDQLRTILEYVGDKRAKDVVTGSRTASEALKLLGQDKSRFRPPVIVDWNNGKAVIGDNESEILKLLRNAPAKSDE